MTSHDNSDSLRPYRNNAFRGLIRKNKPANGSEQAQKKGRLAVAGNLPFVRQPVRSYFFFFAAFFFATFFVAFFATAFFATFFFATFFVAFFATFFAITLSPPFKLLSKVTFLIGSFLFSFYYIRLSSNFAVTLHKFFPYKALTTVCRDIQVVGYAIARRWPALA